MAVSGPNVSATHNSSCSKYCPNALASRLITTSAQSYTVAGAISSLILPTFLVNGVLLFLQLRAKTKAACKLYIVITTLNGCLFSVTALPVYTLLFTLYHQERNCFFEHISIFVVQIETHILAYTVLALAIDRYFCVRPNFGWSKSASRWMQSRIGSTVITSAILILSLFHGLVSVDFFGYRKSTIAKVIMISVNTIIALAVHAAYLKLYCEIKFHRLSFSKIHRNRVQNVINLGRNSNRQKYTREFIKTVSILLIAGILCHVPFLVMDVWTGWYTFGLKTESPQGVRFVYYLSVAPVFMYSAINASLFLYRNDEVKKFCRRMFQASNRRTGKISSSVSHRENPADVIFCI